MVLSGNNSYTKATTISAGTLQVGNGGTSGTLGRGNVANNSSLMFNRNDNYGGNFSNAISGSGSLTVMGGSLNLIASNTYSGLTHVQGGKLAVNGSIAGALQVDAGAALGGSGTIGGNAVLSGTHGPGNSPGIQSFGSSLSYKSASTVLLEFTQNSTEGRGVSFDGINVAGDLSFDPGAVMSLAFNGAGSTVNWNDQFWNNYVKTSDGWLLYSVGGTLSGLNKVTLSGSFLDSNGQALGSAKPNSYFNLYQVGNNVYLNYAVPEPSTYALMGLGALALVVAYRRKSQQAGS
jgi:autotransporter-associated beta strand protein